MYIYTKGIVAQQKSYGFIILRSLRSATFFFKMFKVCVKNTNISDFIHTIYPNCANYRDVFFGTPPPVSKRKKYEIVTIIRIFEKMFFLQKTVTIICAGSSEKA